MKDRNKCYRKNQRIDKSHLKNKNGCCYSILLREDYSCHPSYLLTIEISPRLFHYLEGGHLCFNVKRE